MGIWSGLRNTSFCKFFSHLSFPMFFSIWKEFSSFNSWSKAVYQKISFEGLFTTRSSVTLKQILSIWSWTLWVRASWAACLKDLQSRIKISLVSPNLHRFESKKIVKTFSWTAKHTQHYGEQYNRPHIPTYHSSSIFCFSCFNSIYFLEKVGQQI